LFISLHQSPCYPGTGVENRGNCLNYPLPPGTEPPEFLAAIDEALVRVRNFQAQALAVSAGFDAYKGDPITHMGLEIDTFQDIGARIRRLELPAFAVLEGGYSQEFARCVEAFVSGWDGL
jgi:acetoin utilization deacetylase AcuC-like enzyme